MGYVRREAAHRSGSIWDTVCVVIVAAPCRQPYLVMSTPSMV